MTQFRPGFYPHLAPELQQLRGDALVLWGDFNARRTALGDVVAAWQNEQSDRLSAAVERIDAAVVAGLMQLGMPRGPVLEVQVRWRPGGRHGAKLPTCIIVLSGNYLRAMFELHASPDSIIRTWVHESLHAWQPFTAAEFLAEAEAHKGYEEGLAEGLSRLIVREQAGMEIVEFAYDRYVRAYRVLAHLLGVRPEHVWQSLWTVGIGHVRAKFPTTVAEQLARTEGWLSDTRAVAELQETADLLFASGREDDNLTDSQMERIWRSVLP